MPITSISRDWGIDPQIVRINTTDTLATIMTPGYWTAQQPTILALNNGVWSWRTGDIVDIAYTGGKGFFVYDATQLSFSPQGAGMVQVRLTSAQIIAMSATPVMIVPYVGLNKKVVVGRNTYTYIFATTQYTGGGAIGLEYGNSGANTGVALLAGPAASTTLAAATFNAYAASNVFELTPDNTDTLANVVNRGIFISNTVGAFATGDGSLLVDLEYFVVGTN